MKKIQKIPNEFSLSKYDAVADFDAEQWFVNLEKRYELLTLCRLPIETQIKTIAQKRILKLVENPIVPTSESGGLLFCASDDSVVSLKNKDFFELLQCLQFRSEEDYQNIIGLINKCCQPDKIIFPIDSNLIHKRFWNSDISPDLTAFAKIDLWTSEEKLIADFTSWVKTEKEKRFINIVDNKGGSKIPDKIRKKAPTQADFNQWNKNKVLPCLDLMIWAEANQFKITHAVLGEALFAMDEKIDDSTLKVTRSAKNKADELMDPDTIRIFANHVKKKILPDTKPFYTEDFLQRLKDGASQTTKT